MTMITTSLDRQSYEVAGRAFAESPAIQRLALILASHPVHAALFAELAEATAIAVEDPAAFEQDREELLWLGMFLDGLMTTDSEANRAAIAAFADWQAARAAVDVSAQASLYESMHQHMFSSV